MRREWEKSWESLINNEESKWCLSWHRTSATLTKQSASIGASLRRIHGLAPQVRHKGLLPLILRGFFPLLIENIVITRLQPLALIGQSLPKVVQSLQQDVFAQGDDLLLELGDVLEPDPLLLLSLPNLLIHQTLLLPQPHHFGLKTGTDFLHRPLLDGSHDFIRRVAEVCTVESRIQWLLFLQPQRVLLLCWQLLPADRGRGPTYAVLLWNVVAKSPTRIVGLFRGGTIPQMLLLLPGLSQSSAPLHAREDILHVPAVSVGPVQTVSRTNKLSNTRRLQCGLHGAFILEADGGRWGSRCLWRARSVCHVRVEWLLQKRISVRQRIYSPPTSVLAVFRVPLWPRITRVLATWITTAGRETGVHARTVRFRGQWRRGAGPVKRGRGAGGEGGDPGRGDVGGHRRRGLGRRQPWIGSDSTPCTRDGVVIPIWALRCTLVLCIREWIVIDRVSSLAKAGTVLGGNQIHIQAQTHAAILDFRMWCRWSGCVLEVPEVLRHERFVARHHIEAVCGGTEVACRRGAISWTHWTFALGFLAAGQSVSHELLELHLPWRRWSTAFRRGGKAADEFLMRRGICNRRKKSYLREDCTREQIMQWGVNPVDLPTNLSFAAYSNFHHFCWCPEIIFLVII